MNTPDIIGRKVALFDPALTLSYRADGCGVLRIVTRYAEGDEAEVTRQVVRSWSESEAVAERYGAEIEPPAGFKWRSGNRRWRYPAGT